MPGGGQGAGLRLPVTHHAGGNQVRVVHHRPEGVGQGVAQLASLVDGAGGLGGGVAGDAPGEGELAEQPLHARLVPADVGVDLAVGAVQIVLGHDGVAPVAGAGQIDHVQVILDDDPVQVGVDEVLAGTGAPVAHDGALQVLLLQGLPEQGIVQQVQLAGGQVGVHVVGDQLGVLGARLAFVDRHFHLRLAHAHQGEFGHDEERVHEQEEQHQKQTEGYGHNCGWSSLI